MDFFANENLLKRQIWVYLNESWRYWISCDRFSAWEEAIESAKSGHPVMIVNPQRGFNLNECL